jgi:hypothetical protein
VKRLLVLAPLFVLAGCETSTTARPAVAPPPLTPAPVKTGIATLDSVIGKPAGTLTTMFGKPDAEVREGESRKLQFQSAICVLDAYLYPQGKAEPVVTYVDARQPDGRPIDKASCVAAMARRNGGR